MPIKCRKATQEELEDNFSKGILKLPDELAKRIKQNVYRTKGGIFFYKLKTKKAGITYSTIEDPIYNILTPIKDAFELLKEDKSNKQAKELLNRNKDRLLSIVKELCEGVETKDKLITCLDLGETKDKKSFSIWLRFLRGYLSSCQYKDVISVAEGLRQFYQKHRNFYPEEKEEDAKKLIELLQK